MDIGHSGEKVLIGDSPRMRQIKRLTERLGRGRWPVLILGETGTGKEVAARAIYQSNPVGPFVTVDCSSMVGPLMESELFGHVKGAFTGAATNKIGLLELANGGTAFFDEIGELPLDLQAKLLRVLQEKEFRPVGSVTHRKSDFRILAATNRDLAKEVERGTFRRDLYYRLNVVNIRLAPLRERREDIPLLVEHFVKKYGGNYTLTPEALQVMMEYDWPGNVRELENCVQHMVALNTGPLLHSSDLPSPLQNFMMARRNRAAAAGAGAGGSVEALPEAASTKKQIPQHEPTQPGVILPLMEVERRAILQAITYTKGDRVMAANLLGIGRTTLYRKLKEYQLTA
ncbi:MAG: sigma-54-dependent Fis family transcriptional regulator [Bryobacteraceae bacterium]|nr:sigma-54-dependent Fis family transcriptional regulator [Bryobacteraceae bacterium]